MSEQKCPICGSKDYYETVRVEHCYQCGYDVYYWDAHAKGVAQISKINGVPCGVPEVTDTPKYNYTRSSIVDALRAFARPATSDQLYAHWKLTVDMPKIKQIEAFGPFTSLMGEESAIQAIFRAALIDVMTTGDVYSDDKDLACLKEWKFDPKKKRSLDDDWQS